MAQQVHDLTPQDVSKGMAEGRYLLVDVREPNEVAVDAYPGAVVVPLSFHEAVAEASMSFMRTNAPLRLPVAIA